VVACAGLALAWRAVPRRAVFCVLALAWSAVVTCLSPPAGAVALVLVLASCAAEGIVSMGLAAGGRRWAWAAVAVGLAIVQMAAVGRAALPAADRTAPGLDMLAADVERIAIARGRDAHEWPVLILGERPDPATAWALREMRPLGFADARPAGDGDDARRPMLIAPAEPDARRAPPGHVCTTYASGGRTLNLWVPREP
jgi:hypothetical protein